MQVPTYYMCIMQFVSKIITKSNLLWQWQCSVSWFKASILAHSLTLNILVLDPVAYSGPSLSLPQVNFAILTHL